MRLASTGRRSFTSTIINFAVAAVAISLSVMIITVALVTGFKREISEKIFGFWGHISITDIRADNSYEALPIVYDTALAASISDIAGVEVEYGLIGERIGRSKGGVKHVQAVAQVPGIITANDQMEGIIIKGAGEDYDWSTMREFLRSGSPLAFNEVVETPQIIISEQTASRLEISQGDDFIVHFLKNDRQIQRRFHVQGIYRTGLEEYDQKYAFASLDVVRNLLGWEGNLIAAYEVFVDDVDDAAIINDYIYLEELPSSLYSQTIRSRFPAIFDWLELQDVNMIVILLLTMIVAIINMISVLLVLILDRTAMIGLFKALGARIWQIQELFLYHAAIIILKGMIIGNVIAIVLCFIQDRYRLIKLDETDYYLSYAPVDLELMHVAGINLIALVAIMGCLLIPSLLVSRIDPVKTLQFS